jgi:hypothetical protein
MHACMHACMYVCMYVCMCIQYFSMYICIKIWTCWYTTGLVHACMHALLVHHRLGACVHAMHACMNVRICLCKYADLYKHMDLLVHGGLGAAHDDVVLF